MKNQINLRPILVVGILPILCMHNIPTKKVKKRYMIQIPGLEIRKGKRGIQIVFSWQKSTKIARQCQKNQDQTRKIKGHQMVKKREGHESHDSIWSRSFLRDINVKSGGMKGALCCFDPCRLKMVGTLLLFVRRFNQYLKVSML